MKIILDFFPVLVFFVLYKMFGIYVGTAGLMISSVFQMVLLKIRYGKIEFMYKLSFILILFLNVTLYFMMLCFKVESDSFKLAARNCLLACNYLLKSLIERMMAHQWNAIKDLVKVKSYGEFILWLLVLLTYMLCIITQLLIGLTLSYLEC